MEDQKKFTVKMSRLALLFYMSFGIVAIGLVLLITWLFQDSFNGEFGSNWIAIGLFYFFMLGGGLAITIQQIVYMFIPPTLMTVSKTEITFATGFRYKQYAIPIKYVKKAEGSIIDRHGINLSGANPFPIGVMVYFENSQEIPSNMATSIGVTYFMNTLKISRFHADRDIRETVDAINACVKIS